MLSRFTNFIITSPLIKTIIFVFSTIVSGILAAAFIFEISPSGKINWTLYYRVSSFYLIIFWVILIAVYNYIIYKREIDILRFKDEEYCIAYIRSQCLPEIASKYRELVKSGNMRELKDIVVEIKRITK